MHSESINQLISISERMLQAAENKSWDEVTQLDCERLKGLQELPGTLPETHSQGIADKIQTLTKLDQKIKQVVSQNFEEILSEHNAINKNKKGIKLYNHDQTK